MYLAEAAENLDLIDSEKARNSDELGPCGRSGDNWLQRTPNNNHVVKRGIMHEKEQYGVWRNRDYVLLQRTSYNGKQQTPPLRLR